MSALSMLPSNWPARTRLPSATASASRVPAVLARTTAVCGATSGPENSIVEGIVTSSGATTSRWTNSSVTSALPSLSFLAWADLATSAAVTAAASASSSVPPIHQAFFVCMCVPFRSPLF